MGIQKTTLQNGWFSAVPEFKSSKGIPTNAIFGWIRTLWKLEDAETPDEIVIFFDSGGAQRQLDLLPEYKANRSETPKDFETQIPLIKKLNTHLGYKQLEASGVEADDLIASYAQQLKASGDLACIVSADKDFAQCLEERIIQLLPPPTANPRLGWRVLKADGVPEKFGVSPDQIPDYLALIGDKSDNVDGIRGVGPKTASKWLVEYKNISSIIDNASKIKPERFQKLITENAHILERNLEIITLHKNLDLGNHEAASGKNLRKAKELIQELGMNSLYKELEKRSALQNHEAGFNDS